MNRIVNIILVFALVMGMPLFAEGQAEDGGSAGGSNVELSADQPGWKVDTSPITFDWYIHFSWFPSQWGEGDAVSRYVTEKTGVDINFIVPAGNEAEKLNTLIAGDQLPDFITLGWWEGQVNDMIDGDLVYALDELAEQYDPYFFEVAVDERLGWYTRDDGHVYGYPNASFSPSDYDKYDLPSNQTFLVRKDMYEALGEPEMRTPEGYLDALRRAKEMFPETSGQPLIPFGMHEFGDSGNYSLEAYLQNFLAIPYEENGQLIDRFAHPEYKRWLLTLRQAREEGLITTDVFVDKRAQMEEKIAQGRYFSMLYQRTDFAGQQQILFENDPDSIYIAVDGPANSDMDDPRLAGQGVAGWTITLISKNVEDPARAIRFMSYMLSEEGQKDFYLGVEGVTWENRDGKDQLTPEALEMLQTDRGQFDKVHGAVTTYWMLMDNAMFAQWEPEPVSPGKELVEWTLPYTVSYAAYDNIAPPAGTELGIISSKIVELRGKMLPALLNAESEAEFEEIWDSWIERKEELGLEELMEYQQTKVDVNKTKLGLN
ncbi:extracellular solute-binding protein [Salinispira pacifica]|uniref:Polysaccharide ABC transporter substrate-binding protein n=1 Tax=Salinispira pacifica TaxID=1307761 RepID=V5WF69_9SPIO|nr:extracellular solute-binding protein [Salinispira pacifica]AHC14189.1 Polysaccharide ABC transporter substrate-binding protein [Salinispira pacifica]